MNRTSHELSTLLPYSYSTQAVTSSCKILWQYGPPPGFLRHSHTLPTPLSNLGHRKRRSVPVSGITTSVEYGIVLPRSDRFPRFVVPFDQIIATSVGGILVCIQPRGFPVTKCRVADASVSAESLRSYVFPDSLQEVHHGKFIAGTTYRCTY